MTGTPATSGATPAIGIQVTGTATCAGGKVLLGGGGRVVAAGGNQHVALTESYPSLTTVWTAVGTVTESGAGVTTVTAFALCTK